jgi:hypothetical protein
LVRCEALRRRRRDEDTEREGRSRDDGNGGEIGMVQFYYDVSWGNCNCIKVQFEEGFAGFLYTQYERRIRNS